MAQTARSLQQLLDQRFQELTRFNPQQYQQHQQRSVNGANESSSSSAPKQSPPHIVATSATTDSRIATNPDGNDDGDRNDMASRGRSLSRIFLTPVERYPSPSPDYENDEETKYDDDTGDEGEEQTTKDNNEAPTSNNQQQQSAQQVARDVVESVRQSLHNLQVSQLAGGRITDIDENDEDEEIEDTTGGDEQYAPGPGTACRAEMQIDLVSGNTTMNRTCTTADSIMVEREQRRLSIANEDGDGSGQINSDLIYGTSVLTTPTRVVTCHQDSNATASICAEVHTERGIVRSSRRETVPMQSTVIINGDIFDVDDLFHILESEPLVVFDASTDPISDHVRTALITMIDLGYDNFNISPRGDQITLSANNNNDDGDNLRSIAEKEPVKTNNGTIATTHSATLPAQAQQALSHLQTKEKEYFIKLFNQYARIWAMKIGYEFKPYIQFGIIRHLVHLQKRPTISNLKSVFKTIDILAYLAKESANVDQPMTIHELDIVTKNVSQLFNIPLAEAQRYSLPWILRTDATYAIPFIPTQNEWNEFLQDINTSTHTLSKAILRLQDHVRHRKIISKQKISNDNTPRTEQIDQPVNVVLSDTAFDFYLNQCDPVVIKSAAYDIPITGSLVESSFAKRPYVVHLSQLRLGAPFAAPMTTDVAASITNSIEQQKPSRVNTTTTSSSSILSTAVPDKDIHNVYFVTTSHV